MSGASRQERNRRVGFVIGHQLREIRLLHPDRITGGGSGLMRFGWVAETINADASIPLTYELYRPWRSYDALVFMKAMDDRCQALAARQQRRGGKVVFDANVNFYEEFGHYYFEGMRTGPLLKQQAEVMTRTADAVIADSPYLAEVCARYNGRVEWIPDNVDMSRVPPHRPWRPGGGRLPVLWSGQSHKLFEFLAIEDTLRKYRDRLELVLVTNDLAGLERCEPGVRDRLQRLLGDLAHRLVPYQSIEHLWSVYAQGGICIAPRFLDSAYNLGHTEWKITLAMACGRVALCHPLSSYGKVAERAGGKGIRICDEASQWDETLSEVFSPAFAWEEEERAARAVVETYYDTALIARQHAEFMLRTLGPAG
jgi:hypothetical protein